MSSVRDDLIAACEEVEFTPRDMATWLEYNYSTVQRWLSEAVMPLGFKQKHIARRITLLKKVLATKNGGLPVPPSVTQYQRDEYIEGVRNRALKGIFRAGAAG